MLVMIYLIARGEGEGDRGAGYVLRASSPSVEIR